MHCPYFRLPFYLSQLAAQESIIYELALDFYLCRICLPAGFGGSERGIAWE